MSIKQSKMSMIADIVESFELDVLFIGSTVFFVSRKLGKSTEIHWYDVNWNKNHFIASTGLAIGYLPVSWRKRESQIIGLIPAIKRAKMLESYLLANPISSSYGLLLEQAKQAVYRKRYDVERNLNTVIRSCYSASDTQSPIEAWNQIMCGKGTSFESREPLKPIVCVEKIRKVKQAYIDLLNDKRDQDLYPSKCSTCAGYETDSPKYACFQCNGQY